MCGAAGPGNIQAQSLCWQSTITLETMPVTTAVALKMLQVCGWLEGGRNKSTSPVTKRLSPALSCNSKVSPVPTTSPTTVPPIGNLGSEQETCTLLTLPIIVPVPLVTVHV